MQHRPRRERRGKKRDAGKRAATEDRGEKEKAEERMLELSTGCPVYLRIRDMTGWKFSDASRSPLGS